MSDIAERLRQHIGLDQLDEGDMVALVPQWEVEEAAAEIERLRISVADFKQFAEAAHLSTDERDAEIERLRDALRAVVAKDARVMYERCPDCDYDSCYENKRCKNVPLSQIGIIAREALGE